MSESKTGWWNPTPFRDNPRFHYVTDDGRTLCGKWAYIGMGDVEEGRDGHSENCVACKKKKLALNARAKNPRHVELPVKELTNG